MEREKRRLRKSIYYPVGLSLFLWFIKALESSFSYDFGSYGILPRTLEGAAGIIFAGFIHGDAFHLMSNTIPLMLLGGTIIYFYEHKAIHIILFLYLLTGCFVWLFARSAYHIGASGLVYGMLSFLFFSGLIHRDRQTLAISLAILVLYGGSMFSGLFPGDIKISWESHLIGFVLGLICSVYYRNTSLMSMNQENGSTDEAELFTETENCCNTTANNKNQPIHFQYHYKERSSSDD